MGGCEVMSDEEGELTAEQKTEWLKLARSLAAMNDKTAEEVIATLPVTAHPNLIFAFQLLLESLEGDEARWEVFIVSSCLRRRLNYLSN